MCYAQCLTITKIQNIYSYNYYRAMTDDELSDFLENITRQQVDLQWLSPFARMHFIYLLAVKVFLILKTRLRDIFIQGWKSRLENSTRALL